MKIDAIRELTEQLLLIKISININSVYAVSILDIPIRVLSYFFQVSVTLQSELNHNHGIQSQSAMDIGQ